MVNKIPVLKNNENSFIELNRLLTDGMDIERLIGGQIIDIDLLANETKKISHNMRKTPRGRLTIKQIGNGLVTDSDSWDDKSITIVNNSSSVIKITIILF